MATSDGPWDADIDKIRKSGPIRADIIVAWDHVKPLLISAWQYGYTTGMAHSAKFEEKMRDGAASGDIQVKGMTWNPMSQQFDPEKPNAGS